VKKEDNREREVLELPSEVNPEGSFRQTFRAGRSNGYIVSRIGGGRELKTSPNICGSGGFGPTRKFREKKIQTVLREDSGKIH